MTRLRWRALLVVLSVGLLVVSQQSAATPRVAPATTKLSAQTVPSVHGTKVIGRVRPADLSQGANAKSAERVTWPAGTSTVTMGAKAVRAGSLPLWLGPAAPKRASSSTASA